MHGGVKVYRGAASAARAYVEADRSRADDYYLAEGTGLAQRFDASPQDGVSDLGQLDGESSERWVAGRDPLTSEARGRLREDANAVRFVEITVNGPKTWSLAAALHPQVAAAYEPLRIEPRGRWSPGWPSTPRPVSGRVVGRCRCRWSGSRP